MVRVTIYSRRNCHLCEIAKQRVENVRRDLAFEVEEVDISTDPGLTATYGERIPVVAVDGDEVCVYRVSEGLLRRRVREAGQRKGRCTVEVQDQGQPPMGAGARILGTFLSPGAAFASVRMSCSWVDWVVPWAIAAVLSGAITWKVVPIVSREAYEGQRERIQRNTHLAEDQKKEQLARMDRAQERGGAFGGTMALVMVPVVSLLMLVVFSGIYLGVANFAFGGTGSFRTMMAVTAYTGLIGALGGLVKLPLMLVNDTAKIAMGPDLFFPQGMEHTWGYRLASGVDIFWIWYLVVGSIGAGVVSGVPPKKVGVVIFAIYLLVVGVQAAVRNAMDM